MFKCAHISDIHFRSLKRHDEYKKVFVNLFKKLKSIKDLDLIFIGGDIVHSKTQGITPEIIDLLNWWFTSLAAIAPTHIILGNHDGLILNESRQDAISPIINALDNKNLYLYKKSGTYKTGIDGFNWCVFSCFDEKNWDKVKPIKDEINIACFHGAVRGSLTDTDWQIEGEVNLAFFDDFDFGFLGDIHKQQYLNKEKNIAYSGSAIQQNYGESVKKGFLLWEINSKNDFSSKLIPVANPHPYMTLNWKDSVEDTILFASKVKKGVRFRVKSEKSISQAEIRLLHHYLKNKKDAYEIVYQIIDKENTNKQNAVHLQKTYNIRNQDDRLDLLTNYFEKIDKETIKKLDDVFSKTLDKIPQNLKDVYGQKWSINSLDFENTFSYGKGNYINFDNMRGITGLFGNNRSGKSSIPGTLMYTLFNTTDRGSIKNQDVVNIRKGSCKSTAKITIGSEKYLVERETIKKTNKKNITSATTNLKLTSLNNFENETEEQRRETEKTLKKLIGTSEDFLYTSFASQGEMNTFIKEKNSARKSILSKFLNIKIYEDLYNQSREDYIVLKNRLDTKNEKDWNGLVLSATNNIQLNKEKILNLEENTSELRNNLISFNIELNNIKVKTKKHSSGYTLSTAINEKQFLNNKNNTLTKEKDQIKKEIENIALSLEKIDKFKNSFSIDDLNNEKERLLLIEKKLNIFKNERSLSKKNKHNIENELKILDQVPCEDNFPNCKFIKKAHEGKKEIFLVNKTILEIETNILELNNIIKKLKDKEINEKIRKFESILKKEYKLNIDKESFLLKLGLKEKEINAVLTKIENINSILIELKDLNTDQFAMKENELQNNITLIQNKINKNSLSILEHNKNIFKLDEDIRKYKEEKEDYTKLIEDFRIYDIFSSCVSKKGIPTMLINSSLPKLNNEINTILNGVVSFKIFIEEDEKGSNLNVYIDYGDSKRIIECASGMEKMISSIAIRVALINISSLAKSDIFVIDEGFGSLDDSNIETCNRLLNSLKRHFKSIIIISHIDAIKDIVDKNIEISIKGKDSHVRFE
jgi:DNA repair exonuclease SbcCD ATPase subunit